MLTSLAPTQSLVCTKPLAPANTVICIFFRWPRFNRCKFHSRVGTLDPAVAVGDPFSCRSEFGWPRFVVVCIIYLILSLDKKPIC